MFTKKSKKLIILFIVCLLMSMSILTGCGEKETDKLQGTNNLSEDKKEDKFIKDEAPSESEGDGSVIYPISDGDVTLKIWIPINEIALKYMTTYRENEAYMRIMEDTGVDIEFIHPPSGQEKEAFNIMIASKDYPDIVMPADYYQGGEVQGVEDGIYEDLTDLIPKYAPDYHKLLEEDDDFRKGATGPDGRNYSIFRYDLYAKVGGIEAEGEWYRTQFRKDWLEEFEMEPPRTLDEYEDYFEKVLENKPDVVPFMLESSGLDRYLLIAYDISYARFGDYYLKDDKIMWYGADPRFEDYLVRMNKWYEAGYIGKDFTSADTEKMFLAGDLATYIGNSVSIFQKSQQLNIDTIPGPYPREQDPNQEIRVSYKLFTASNHHKASIMADSEYKEEALKFLNYGYTDLGWKTYQYGPKDIAWTEGPGGQPMYTDHVLNNPDIPIMDVNYVIRLHGVGASIKDGGSKANPSNYTDPEALNYRLIWADDDNVKNDAVLPDFVLSAEQSKTRDNIMADVETYVEEMALKFITGAEPLDKIGEYYETIKSLGIDDAIAITQDAYDAYLAK